MKKTKDLPTGKEFPALWARMREVLIPAHTGLSQLGVKPAQGPPQALAAPRAKRSPGKALQAYQRGLTASPSGWSGVAAGCGRCRTDSAAGEACWSSTTT